MHPPFEPHEPDDSEPSHQPKYESLVMLADDRFALTTRLPSGAMIEIPLGRELPGDPFWIDQPD